MYIPFRHGGGPVHPNGAYFHQDFCAVRWIPHPGNRQIQAGAQGERSGTLGQYVPRVGEPVPPNQKANFQRQGLCICVMKTRSTSMMDAPQKTQCQRKFYSKGGGAYTPNCGGYHSYPRSQNSPCTPLYSMGPHDSNSSTHRTPPRLTRL